MEVQCERGDVMYHHGVWAGATTSSCCGRAYALALTPPPPLYMFVYCNSNPRTALGAHPLEVPSVAENTQVIPYAPLG